MRLPNLRKTPEPEQDGNAKTGETGSDTAFKRKIDCKFEDFELGKTLGTGTFGRVRLAKFKRAAEVSNASNFYALKILKKSEILRLKQLAHMKNEMELLSLVENPFIVNLVNHFQDELRLMMVLEFVPGGELFSYLRNVGRLRNEDARFYAAQVVMVFGYLHSHKIAYRDLKPENLLVDRQGYLKLADFGFAKIVSDRTWTVCGTPEYLAPEIIQNKGHGPAVDWWASGILFYEMMAGYPPFWDEHPYACYQKILNGNVEYPGFMDPKAVSLMRKLLQADITKRIGCLKGGHADVQKSKWFSKTKWRDLYARSIPATFIPEVKSEEDTSNFDHYEDSPPGEQKPLTKDQQEMFESFDMIGYNAKRESSEEEPQVQPQPQPQE